jgi:hypothetical protein
VFLNLKAHCVYLVDLYKVSTVSKLYLPLTLSACYRSPCLCCVSLSEGALHLPHGPIQGEHCIKALRASHPVCLLLLSLFGCLKAHCVSLVELYKVSTVSKLYVPLTLSACYRSPCLCCVSLFEGALHLPHEAIQSEHCIKALLASHPVCLLPLSLFVLCFFV